MNSPANPTSLRDEPVNSPADPVLVNAELSRILADSPFCNSKRLSDFLRYVVAEALAGRGDRIKQYSVALSVFGRPDDFDPQADPIVRIHAGRVRRALDAFYQQTQERSELEIRIPVGTYRPEFHISTSGASRPQQEVRRLRSPSIVVMPFIYQGGRHVDEYVLQGMVEELSAELTLFPFIEVSTLNHGSNRLKQLQPAEAAKAANADFALLGTIRTDQERMRLTLHLYRTESDQKVWSHRSEHSLPEDSPLLGSYQTIRALASLVADTFGAVQRINHSEARAKDRSEPDAYNAILSFHQYQLTMAGEDFDRTLNLLEAAYTQHPDNAAICAKLGLMYLDALAYGYPGVEDAWMRGSKLARRAKALDPMNQQAHFTNAFARLIDGDPEGMMRSTQRILEINPNSAYMTGAAAFFTAVAGDFDTATSLFEQSAALNPFHPNWFHFIPFVSAFNRGDYQTALAAAHDFSMPDFYWTHIMTAAAYGELQQADKQAKALRRLAECNPDFADNGRNDIRLLVQDEALAMKLLAALKPVRISTAG